MEYTVINTEDGDILISDGKSVKRFDAEGRPKFEGIPSLKMFRELGYLIPPEFIEAESIEKAIRTLKSM